MNRKQKLKTNEKKKSMAAQRWNTSTAFRLKGNGSEIDKIRADEEGAFERT